MRKQSVRGVLALLVLLTATIASAQQAAGVSKPGDSTNSSAGGAQQPSSQQGEEAQQRLRVVTRMVLIDAVVTDGSGKPVGNLKADDFKVLENGKPQTIRAFGARSPELLREQAEKVAPKHPLPPGLFTNITDFHVEYGPLTILLVDSLNTPQFDQPYMRDALIKYLQGVGPRQNIVIYSLGTHLGLVQNLNTDPQLLQEALKRIKENPKWKNKDSKKAAVPAEDPEARARQLAADLLGVGREYDKERQIAQMEDSVFEFFPDIATQQRDLRVQATLAALKKITASVAGYPGRKNLIWLSAGFPISIDPINNGFSDVRDYAPDVQDAANLLTTGQVAIYPVDVRGLVPNFLPDPASDVRRFGSFSGSRAAGTISSRSVALGYSHATMDHMAQETGGRAYYNRNDIDHGIATSVQDGSTYYSIGYYPEDKNWDGRYRKIEVKLARKGVQIHYRRGYYATDATHVSPEENKEALKDFTSALALDAPASTLLPIVAYVAPPDKEHSDVYVNIGVDPHAVIFEPQMNNRQAGQVEFATIVLDVNGKPVTSKSDILNTELTPETFNKVMSGSLVVRQKFALNPGKYLIRVGVRDLKSTTFGTLIARVDVPAPAQESDKHQ